METNVDMKYSFLQDDEPTDEQLLVIMEEVAEDARRQRKELAAKVLENIEREYNLIRSKPNNEQTE